MTDIVDRLRAMSLGRCEGSEWGAGTCAIAADEIERLRAEIVLLEATGAEAADEIERLRAALRQIASGNTCMALTTHPPICARAHTARAALGENNHD